MATSGRQAALFGVQDWRRIYQTYREANFQSYDYETLRKSFIDYLTAYYPETFNDYIESSEFVALLDVIAFMGQALAFRGDLNARENFLDTAERRDSVVKLANLVSYNPKRNIAGQGLVKISAVSTTESVQDLNGINLSNTTILWNDPANASWQDQFNQVLNSAFVNSQRVGRPGNSQNILGVKTDEYTVNIPAGQLPVVPYSADIDGIGMNFELVSATSANKDYLYELPPAPSSQFNMLYRNDKLGYGSPNTGFFFYFKQGTLQNFDFGFTEKIQNQLQPIDIQGVNETDTWLYQLDSDNTVSALWSQVENLFINSNLQGTSNSKIFSVTSRTNDQVTYIFGDGVFGEIPVGNFRAYVRSSNSLTYTIDPSEMSGIAVNLNYISRTNKLETLTFTFSLQQVSNTALQRESIAEIKERAPARYYTQNRMVNGEDYTNFPFTLYNSIIKSSAVNRTSIGVTRNQDLLDPTGKYSSTNVFGDDGSIYVNDRTYTTSFSTISINVATSFLSLQLPALLGTTASVQYYQRYYPRYSGSYAGSLGGNCFWNLTTTAGNYVNGYFYIKSVGDTAIPVTTGTYSSESPRYISPGAQIKFVPPAGEHFDRDNRLQAGPPNYSAGDTMELWCGVIDVIGDGNNFGEGNLPTGAGPVTLSDYVPNGAIIDHVDGIIPQFDTTLGSSLISDIITQIELNQSFSLIYDNSKVASLERWSISTVKPVNPTPTSYFVTFIRNSVDNSYTVNIQNTVYSFGSVEQVRFLFDGTQRIFDPKTGKVLTDTITVLKNNENLNPIGGDTLGRNYILNITGQQVQSDGYPEDYQVTVSTIDPNNNLSYSPDFFKTIVGPDANDPGYPPASGSQIIFFNTDANSLAGIVMLPVGEVLNSVSINNQSVAANKAYDYPAGTVFYCSNGSNTQYQLSSVDTVAWPDNQTLWFQGNTAQSTRDTIINEVWTPYTKVVTIDPVTSNTYTYAGQTAVSVNSNDPSTNTTRYGITFGIVNGSISQAPVTTQATATFTPQFYQSYLVPGSSPKQVNLNNVTNKYFTARGRGNIYFQYRHNATNTVRVDPGTTNIIDLFLVTQAYYTQYQNWIKDTTGTVPLPAKPTISELQQDYGNLNNYKMVSDNIVLNSVNFKPLFGLKAVPPLRGTIKVIKSLNTTVSDSQIRSSVVATLNSYFTIDKWNFGDTFYFSELASYLHVQLGTIISSVVLVPADPTQTFGDLYEIRSAPNEIFVNGATESDVVVVSALTPSTLQRQYRLF